MNSSVGTAYWIVARMEHSPWSGTGETRFFYSAKCIHETEEEARECCPATLFAIGDDWVKEDVVRSDEDRDPLLADFVETWGAISDDNTGAMFDPARRN